jgi:hypothetical protein
MQTQETFMRAGVTNQDQMSPAEYEKAVANQELLFQVMQLAILPQYGSLPDYHAALDLDPTTGNFLQEEVRAASNEAAMAIAGVFIRGDIPGEIPEKVYTLSRLTQFISKAQEVLSTPHLKALYDEERKKSIEAAQSQTKALNELQVEQDKQRVALQALLAALEIDARFGTAGKETVSAITNGIHGIRQIKSFSVFLRNDHQNLERDPNKSRQMATHFAGIINAEKFGRSGLSARVTKVDGQPYYQLVIQPHSNFFISRAQ